MSAANNEMLVSGSKWQALRDSNTNQTFYHNTQTTKSQWDKPYEMTAYEEHVAASQFALQQVAARQLQAAAMANAANAASAWQTGADVEGRKYYFNAVSGVAQYDRPLELGPVAAEPKPSAWRQYQAATGELYYHNSATGQSQYERPQGL